MKVDRFSRSLTSFDSGLRPSTTGAIASIEERCPISSPEAEALAEEFIEAATSGESVGQEAEDEVAMDEDGGPYLLLSDSEDLGDLLEEERVVWDERARSRGAQWVRRRRGR